MSEDQMTPAEAFESLFTTCVKRDGAKELLDWLKKTDFFIAPASTQYHGNYPGGLCDHSLHVYMALRDEMKNKNKEGIYSDETIVLVSLLHDLCKVNFYEKYSKNVKNPTTGQWEAVDAYKINEALPFGHGEKSVFLISRFLRLSLEEACAINAHMGGYDERKNVVGKIFEQYPLALELHIADMRASYQMDKKI